MITSVGSAGNAAQTDSKSAGSAVERVEWCPKDTVIHVNAFSGGVSCSEWIEYCESNRLLPPFGFDDIFFAPYFTPTTGRSRLLVLRGGEGKTAEDIRSEAKKKGLREANLESLLLMLKHLSPGDLESMLFDRIICPGKPILYGALGKFIYPGIMQSKKNLAFTGHRAYSSIASNEREGFMFQIP